MRRDGVGSRRSRGIDGAELAVTVLRSAAVLIARWVRPTHGGGFTADAVPPTWHPEDISSDAFSRTTGYEHSLKTTTMSQARCAACLTELQRATPLRRYAGARVFSRVAGSRRRTLAGLAVANLALNAGWNAVFFRGQAPWPAAVDALALTATTVAFAAATRPADPRAALLLVPYAAWTGFATALTTAIAVRN